MSKAAVIFVLLSAAYFLVSFQRLCLGMLAPDIAAELQLGVAALGSLGSAFHYSYALFQIPGGYFIDRYGPRLPLTLFFGLSGGLGAFLFAVSQNLATAFGGRLLAGLGMSIVLASSCKVISAIFRQGLYMRLLSVFFAAGGLGMLFSAAPLEILNRLWGWRQLFLACGVLTVGLGACFWLLLRGGAGAPAPPERAQTRAEGARKGDSFLSMVRRLFASPGFVPFLVWYIITPAIFFSFASLWAAPFYETAWGLAHQTVGIILSVGILGVIIGTPAGAWLAERLGSRIRVIRIAAVLALGGSLMLCLPAGGAALPLAVCSFTCICLSGNLGASVIYALVRDHIPEDLVGLSTAVMSSSLFIMTAVLQMCMGWLLGLFAAPSGELPYARVFLVYAGLGVASLALALRLREHRR
ncbi:MAG: MFS transporter [Desulfovibrio sp.]|nr:MFS transporter [Desulfovibrio sp.]